MSDTLTLTVTAGPDRGRNYAFPLEEFDTLLCGRQEDCHVALMGDGQVSRLQFILELHPPAIILRDLHSLYGTEVDGKRYGGREEEEQVALVVEEQVELADDCAIKVGQTVLRVKIKRAMPVVPATPVLPAMPVVPATPTLPEDSAELETREEPAAEKAPVCRGCGVLLGFGPSFDPHEDPLCEECHAGGLEVEDLLTTRMKAAPKAKADPADLPTTALQAAPKARETVSPDLPTTLMMVPLREKHDLSLPMYEVERQIAGDNVSKVYLVRHKRRHTQAVLKVIQPHIALNERIRRHFQQEIHLTQKLRHRHLADYLDDGVQNDLFYFLIEYCPGGSLERLVRGRAGGLPLAEAAPLLVQTLEGMAYVHKKDHVHRDLKPSNVLLTGEPGAWSVKIGDLGLAKSLALFGLRGPTLDAQGGHATYAFMPHEQLRNFRHVRPVSDIWSLGATFYYLLSGQYPRQELGGDPLNEALQAEIVPLGRRAPHLPPSVIEIIDRALAHRPEDRYQNAGRMLTALQKAL